MPSLREENADIKATFEHVVLVKNNKIDQYAVGVKMYDGKLVGFEIPKEIFDKFLDLQEDIKSK